MFFTWWRLVWAIVGAFGTAYVFQHTGRETRQGGLIGLAVGGLLGPLWLVGLWIWAYYTRLNVYVYKEQRPWHQWWRP